MAEEYRSFEEIFGENGETPDAPAEPEAETPDAQETTDTEGSAAEGTVARAPDGHAGSAGDGDDSPAAGDDNPEVEDGDDKEETADDDKPKEEKPPEPPRVHKLKVDGKELEVDDDELVRGYSTGKAANQRFQEAKQLHEQATSFYNAFLRSPGDALVDLVAKQIGDRTKARERVRDVFLEFLAPDLEESLIQDERERGIYRRERAIADRQAELDRKQAEENRRMSEAEMTDFVGGVKTRIEAGLKKHGLPSRDPIWMQAGQILDVALKAGQSREAVLEMVPQVMAEIAREREESAKKLVGTLSPEELARMFPDAVEALKKQRIAKVTAERAKKTPAGETTIKAKSQREPKSKYKSWEEAFGG